MSDVKLTEAEVKALEDASWNGGRAGWLAAVTDIKTSARAEGAREALREAAEALVTEFGNDGFPAPWLRDRAGALDTTTPHDDRPGGCLHGPGARPGVCPNCGTVVSEETP